jgi:hypothetical protein
VERQKRISESKTITSEEILAGIAEIARDTTRLPRVRLAAWAKLAELKGMTGPARKPEGEGAEPLSLVHGAEKVEPPKTIAANSPNGPPCPEVGPRPG